MKTESRKPRVTLKTVAERAGVSVTTVSLILSGREEWLAQFHPDTVTRVQQCAKRLGYRVNLFATGLPSGASPFFSLVLADMGETEPSTWHHWAFEGSLLAGVVRASTTRRRFPVVATAHRDSDIQPVARVIDGGVFGSIVRTKNPALERFIRLRIRQGHPTVIVFPTKTASWPSNTIDVDNVAIGRSTAALLGRRGRRKWMLIRYQKATTPHRLRCEGFSEGARQAGVSVDVVRLPMDVDESRVRDLLAPRLRRTKVDGIFALDSVSSVGTLLACLEAGRHPAGDTDLVGCDSALWQSGNLPRITSVDISWREVGAVAFTRLMEMVDAGRSQFDSVLLEPRVTVGGTCPADRLHAQEA